MRIRRYDEVLVPYIPGLCQENRPQSERPYSPDWVVNKISLDLGNNSYWIYGINLNNYEQFHWNFVAGKPLSWRFDFNIATQYYIGQHES